MTDEQMKSLACLIGRLGSVELRRFEESLGDINEDRKRFLLRCYLALFSMPTEAEREREILELALCRLRDMYNKETT